LKFNLNDIKKWSLHNWFYSF